MGLGEVGLEAARAAWSPGGATCGCAELQEGSWAEGCGSVLGLSR